MNIALVGSGRNPHMKRWVHGLVSCGHQVHLITQDAGVDFPLARSVTELPYNGGLGYYLNARALRKVLTNLKPDIVHAHYASGYGTLLRRTNYHPYILSVWGSDLLVFPKKSILHHSLLKNNLDSAARICSTSHCMRRELMDNFNVPDSKIFITPFGVDPQKFFPMTRKKDFLTIGTVKTLEKVYGIDRLIEVVSSVIKQLHAEGNHFLADKIRLVIAGAGKDQLALTNLAAERGISGIVNFMGHVDQDSVPQVLNKMDIFCAFSRSESFGVSVLEASACAIPVVVTNVGGLPEVVRNTRTGYVVNEWSRSEAAAVIKQLLLSENLRNELGAAGREFVLKEYTWSRSLSIMQEVYSGVLKG